MKWYLENLQSTRHSLHFPEPIMGQPLKRPLHQYILNTYPQPHPSVKSNLIQGSKQGNGLKTKPRLKFVSREFFHRS